MTRATPTPCHLRRPAQVRATPPGRDACHRTKGLLSSVNELSFLPISRPRPVPSATQLSTIHGLPAADSHVHAACEPAGGVGRTSSRAIFIVTSNHLAARETGKTGTAAVAGCQRRFLSAGQKHGSRNLRCHGTPTTRRNNKLMEHGTNAGSSGGPDWSALAAMVTCSDWATRAD
jgi:hypothetical protein